MAPQNIPHAISVLTLGNKVILCIVYSAQRNIFCFNRNKKTETQKCNIYTVMIKKASSNFAINLKGITSMRQVRTQGKKYSRYRRRCISGCSTDDYSSRYYCNSSRRFRHTVLSDGKTKIVQSATMKRLTSQDCRGAGCGSEVSRLEAWMKSHKSEVAIT